MNTRLLSTLLMAFSFLFAGVQTVSADSIGINFFSEKNTKQSTLADDAVAGIDSAKQQHWNNMTVTNDDANGRGNSGSILEVKNDQGKPVPATTVKANGDKDHQVWAVGGATWGFSGNNLTLQKAHLHVTPMITVCDVPYKKYDVIVYISAGNSGGIGKATIEKANNVDGDVSEIKTVFVNYAWADGKFKQAKATTADEAKTGGASNYVVFPGITASDFTVTFDGKVHKGWLGVSAIQIVETK